MVRFVEVNGARLAVEVDGEGPTVVLLHAGICDRRMWTAQVLALRTAFQVVHYDARGFGESSLPPGPYAHWQDLRSLLDVLGVPEACFVGASMGGGTAIDLALAEPQRVRKLVLVAPAISGFQKSAWLTERQARIEAAYQAHGIAAACEEELRLWVDGPHRGPEAVPAAIREQVRAMNTVALTWEESQPDAQAVVLDPPAIGRLREIRAETLVVEGELDVPDASDRVALATTRIPGARRLTVPGTAHLPSLEQPELFDRAILGFL